MGRGVTTQDCIERPDAAVDLTAAKRQDLPDAARLTNVRFQFLRPASWRRICVAAFRIRTGSALAIN